MANDKFSISESLQYGWDAVKANVPFFISFILVMVLSSLVPDIIVQKIFAPKSAGLVVAKIILRLIGVLIGMLSLRLFLDIYDSGKPNFSTLTEILPQYPWYLIGQILFALSVIIGMILLIVPGVLAYLMFFFTTYIIVDRSLGPLAAMQESRAITDGYKLDLLVFTLAMIGVNLLGLICLGVGLFVSFPITFMASIYVYRKLSPAEAAA